MLQSIYTRNSTIPREVANLKRETEDFKSAQNSGGSSIILYTTETTDSWDVVDANINTAGLYSTWLITFVPDISEFAHVEFGLNYQYNANQSSQNIYYYIDPLIASTTGVQRFIVFTQNNPYSATTLSLKFQVRSSSPGYIFWSRSAS